MRNTLLAAITLLLLVLCMMMAVVIYMLFEPGPGYRPREQRGGVLHPHREAMAGRIP